MALAVKIHADPRPADIEEGVVEKDDGGGQYDRVGILVGLGLEIGPRTDVDVVLGEKQQRQKCQYVQKRFHLTFVIT